MEYAAEDNKNVKNQDIMKSGQMVTTSIRLIKEIDINKIDTSMVEEILAVGAGIGGRLDHTSKVQPMKYDEAMATPKARN